MEKHEIATEVARATKVAGATVVGFTFYDILQGVGAVLAILYTLVQTGYVIDKWQAHRRRQREQGGTASACQEADDE